MLARLCAAFVRLMKRVFPPTAVLEARGGGPALDRALDLEEISIEAAERGLTGRDRDERQADQQVRLARHITQADVVPGQERKLRIGDYFPNGKVPM